jgi:lipoate-protein ligase A
VTKKWFFINNQRYQAQKNMQIDLSILEKAMIDSIAPVLRIYSWSPPALSLGCNQKIATINETLAREYDYDIVHRPTGGRALFHQGDICYSFVINKAMLKMGHNVSGSYKEISAALIEALKYAGIENVKIGASDKIYTKSPACMAISTGADLEYKGKKISGSAQLRKNDYILQHGTILLNQDFSLAAKMLHVDDEALNCINVSDILKREMPAEEIATYIKHGFETTFECQFTSMKSLIKDCS